MGKWRIQKREWTNWVSSQSISYQFRKEKERIINSKINLYINKKSCEISQLFAFNISIELIKYPRYVTCNNAPRIFSKKIDKRRRNNSFYCKKYNSANSKFLYQPFPPWAFFFFKSGFVYRLLIFHFWNSNDYLTKISMFIISPNKMSTKKIKFLGWQYFFILGKTKS